MAPCDKREKHKSKEVQEGRKERWRKGRRKEKGEREKSEQKVEVERKEGRERVREGGRDCTSVWGRFCASCGILATNPAAMSSLGSG